MSQTAGLRIRDIVTRHIGPSVVAVVLIPFGCDSGPTEIQESRMGGELSLTAYDGFPLPVDLGPVTTRDGSISECHFFVDHGFLTLEPDYGVFDLAYEVLTCDGRVLDRPNTTGVYWIEGDRWKFLLPAVAETVPDVFLFEGSRNGNSLLVTGHAAVPLEFSGDFVAHPPRPRQVGGREKPIGAAHSLVARNGVPTVCLQGFLIMEPDYRIFELGVQTSCDDPATRQRWFGVYGQTADRLEFVAPSVAEDGEDLRFSGRISGGQIHVVDPLGQELVFARTGIIAEW